jgi:hypothetical protein
MGGVFDYLSRLYVNQSNQSINEGVNECGYTWGSNWHLLLRSGLLPKGLLGIIVNKSWFIVGNRRHNKSSGLWCELFNLHLWRRHPLTIDHLTATLFSVCRCRRRSSPEIDKTHSSSAAIWQKMVKISEVSCFAIYLRQQFSVLLWDICCCFDQEDRNCVLFTLFRSHFAHEMSFCGECSKHFSWEASVLVVTHAGS